MNNQWFIVQDKNTGLFLSRPTPGTNNCVHDCLVNNWQDNYVIKFDTEAEAAKKAKSLQEENEKLRKIWLGEWGKPIPRDYIVRKIEISYNLV